MKKGIKVKFERDASNNLLITECDLKQGVKVNSVKCLQCEHFISSSKLLRIVLCDRIEGEKKPKSDLDKLFIRVVRFLQRHSEKVLSPYISIELDGDRYIIEYDDYENEFALKKKNNFVLGKAEYIKEKRLREVLAKSRVIVKGDFDYASYYDYMKGSKLIAREVFFPKD